MPFATKASFREWFRVYNDFAQKWFATLMSLSSNYRSQRFGSIWGDFLFLSSLVNTDALQDTQWNINMWTDEEVLAWKESHLASSNAIAVAGAIFASVGLSALQLPNMDAVHWTARGFCVSSMFLGIMSVIAATGQYQFVGMLNTPVQIRLWLSRGPSPDWDLIKMGVHPSLLQDQMLEMSQALHDNDQISKLPLESAITAGKVIALSRNLLTLAVTLFNVGFGLYLLFLWLDNVETSGVSHRNVFLLFIVTWGLYEIYDKILFIASIQNEYFKNKMLGGNPQYYPPYVFKLVQQVLRKVQQHVQDGSEKSFMAEHTNQTSQAKDEPTVRPWRSTTDDVSPRLGGSVGDRPHPDRVLSMDKHDAWRRYMTAYVQRRKTTEEALDIMRVMELKGGFEAEWDEAMTLRNIDRQSQRPHTRVGTAEPSLDKHPMDSVV
ncbi:hypothetical protein EDD37DRAFT_403940 [Exophiala viscosa]|uniref:Uncharacterized protein n=1 Tax=Exophiala viscosa TaxID=2486360 RepID=A0AAN6IEE0_9EURO|nr:hypothetical protein EDD36DRAFT_168464 [Exophiala viscosa]KAI1624203.1 hypothetical protein EDD37DRAFT_403940 [Exophiala viscosa]